jgi:hypothetical protein
MSESLSGRFREAYEFSLRTHVHRRVSPSDNALARAYPKLTILALSDDYNAVFARDILLAKQRAEQGEDMFEHTAEIGRRLAEKYVYSKDPSLRPTDSEFLAAKETLRVKQMEEEDSVIPTIESPQEKRL